MKRPNASKPRNVLITGTGLIGASAGLALRRRTSAKIEGWDHNRTHSRSARRRGALDTVASQLEPALARADVILLATPLAVIVQSLPRIIRGAKAGAFVLDVGPLFKPVVGAARVALRRRKDVAFVAGHPIAGRESSGPANAQATLFEAQPFALFAPPQTERATAWRRAETFVRLLGGRPVRIEPTAHDRMMAATSALPQIASIALALAVGRSVPRASRLLSGPGFEGATRLAESSFSIWEGALAGNARNAAQALRAFEKAARALRVALESGNMDKIEASFRAAAASRRRILAGSGRRAATRTSSRIRAHAREIHSV